MDTFLPRVHQHAVIQQVGPALIVAGLIMTASGRADQGAAYAEEYCVLTDNTPAYRHMELADLVRLLVAASRADRAVAVADDDVIPTIRNECESRTAEAVLASTGGDAGAVDIFHQAAALWRSFGHPLEEHLALASATALRRDAAAARRAELLATDLRLAAESVAALCPHHASTDI